MKGTNIHEKIYCISCRSCFSWLMKTSAGASPAMTVWAGTYNLYPNGTQRADDVSHWVIVGGNFTLGLTSKARLYTHPTGHYSRSTGLRFRLPWHH